MSDKSEVSSEVAPVSGSDRVPAPGKKLKRVRKVRASDTGVSATNGATAATPPPRARGSLLRSPIYLALVLLRLVLIATPGVLESSEHADGVDLLAAAMLPGLAPTPAMLTPPAGMSGTNATRSIVGATLTSGLPYAAVAFTCKRAPKFCPPPSYMGVFAVYLPRVWMFALSLLTDALLFRVFAVHESEHAVSAVITYASTWTSLVGVTRNSNFALEALCLTAVLAGCFGWSVNSPRPLFWLSGAALSVATFLRPINFFFVLTPIIYLSSLWGKGVRITHYIMAAMEGLAIFAFWTTIWVSLDSVFYGTFKLRFGGTVAETFDMFMDLVMSGEEFSYAGSLVYTPISAAKLSLNRAYLKTLAHNTTPGQMFLSLPGILGPLFIVLMRESYKGMLVAVKELMSEVKAVTNSKKGKKKKGKKNQLTKEKEEELMVFFDTIQTTFLLGLLMEVVQNNERLGIISLMSLIPPAVMCMPSSVFGEKSSQRYRLLHIAFTVGMVLFFGVMNQSGVQRMMLSVGAGGVSAIQKNSHVVVFKGLVGHRAALGPNLKNITIHDGIETRLRLMTVLRELKSAPDYHEDKLLIAAAGTVEMKDHEFKLVSKVNNGHMSMHDMPQNVDDALKKSNLALYKFVGDEDESILSDMAEAEEEEARKQEEKKQGSKEEL